MGPKPPGPKWKRAETSGGQIRKGPKPLATTVLTVLGEGINNVVKLKPNPISV